MAATFPTTLKGIFRNYELLSLDEAQEVFYLLSLEDVDPDKSITTKTLAGFVAALSIFPANHVFYDENHREFMWSPIADFVAVGYSRAYQNMHGEEIEEVEVDYYSKEKFVRVWSKNSENL